LTLRVTIGRKGYIIIPKAVRELVGVREGDTLLVKVEGRRIILEPEVSVDVAELRRKLERHWARVRRHLKAQPRLGDLRGASLEEEFEDDLPGR